MTTWVGEWCHSVTRLSSVKPLVVTPMTPMTPYIKLISREGMGYFSYRYISISASIGKWRHASLASSPPRLKSFSPTPIEVVFGGTT